MADQHKRTTSEFSNDARNRFVGGRKRLNAQRKMAQLIRRAEVARLAGLADVRKRGWQSRIAETIGCHRSVISRDLVAIRQISQRQKTKGLN